MDRFLDKIPSLITKEDNIEMLKPDYEEEVHVVLFSMGPFKVPGPNGFALIFFQDIGILWVLTLLLLLGIYLELVNF